MFSEYTKLIESSNPLETAIIDKLLPIDFNTIQNNNNILGITHTAEQDNI
jgi:hypothetical protein